MKSPIALIAWMGVLAGLACETGAAAMQGGTWKLVAPPNGNFGGIHFKDGRNGHYLTADGAVFTTSDGGSQWSPIPAPRLKPALGRSFSVVDFPDPQVGYALGNVLARTTDGGATWDSLAINDRGADIHFVDRDTGYIVGWTYGPCGSSRPGCIPPILAVFHKTKDGGKTWKTVSIETQGPVKVITVACADARHCYAAGHDGKVYGINRLFTDTTLDVIAARLDIRETGNLETLIAMDFPSPSTGYAVGSNGIILKTGDGGLTWSPQPYGRRITFRAVTFLDAERGFVAGDSGTLLYTSNGGQTWYPQPKLTDRRITSLECPTEDACFAAGEQYLLEPGTILRLEGGMPSPVLYQDLGRPGLDRAKARLRVLSSPTVLESGFEGWKDLLGRRGVLRIRSSGIVVPAAP